MEPAQTSRVSFTLTADELYYFNEARNSFEVEPGVFTARVGGPSDNLPLSKDFTIHDGPRKPDLLITGITMVPRYPVLGDRVLFLATVKNQGTGPTPAGTPLKVSFRVDGKDVSWSDEFSGSIPAGGMALVCANKGPAGSNMWIADAVENFSVEGGVDPENVFDETVEDNNIMTIQASGIPTPPKNLALRRPVVVSSVEAAGLEGEKAVDGYPSTRWSSSFSDPQSITVDLGGIFNISQVVLRWETAFGEEFDRTKRLLFLK